MEIRTSVSEIIAQRVNFIVICALIGFVSYHVGRYTMNKEIKLKEKYENKGK